MAEIEIEGSGKRKGGQHPIMALLGAPVFREGNRKRYPRTVGWGKSQTPHPDGGTNETAAFVMFKPFRGSEVTLEGSIYCERFQQAGKAKRRFSISLPFLSVDRKDATGAREVESLKILVRDLYRVWETENPDKTSAEDRGKVGSWEESDD